MSALPAEVAERYGFSKLRGTHLVGHTRMATETAVTPANAHPFTAGEDFCLVHNGSLSNPDMLRRKLEPLGIAFETRQRHRGRLPLPRMAHARRATTLETALQHGFDELDGFYTFLMGTRRQARAGARRVRLQAGGGRRDRRLRGDRLGVPLARASAGCRERHSLRAEARGDVLMDGVNAVALRPGVDDAACASSISFCTAS